MYHLLLILILNFSKGGDSDDEGAEDSPDEDQYDTDDPFIDDEELVCDHLIKLSRDLGSLFFAHSVFIVACVNRTNPRLNLVVLDVFSSYLQQQFLGIKVLLCCYSIRLQSPDSM